MRHALVIGAGIGGLAAAAGLRNSGWRVTVMERSDHLGEVGAGIALWPNALYALDALGLTDRLLIDGHQPYNGTIRASDGTVLSRVQQRHLERAAGRPAIAVHRAHLHRVLVEAVGEDVIRTGTRVTEVRSDGTVPETDLPAADLVIGADGIDSRVRDNLWTGSEVAYSGLTAWRGICQPERPIGPELAGVSWGRGQEFGSIPLVDGRVYWYASMPAPEGRHDPDEKAVVRREFDWHHPIPELVEATPATQILRNDMRWLHTPLRSYRSGRVVLLGDAAHAMMPNLGQGACQALEDAAVLAYACRDYANPDEASNEGLDRALDRYDAERRPRSQRVARMSLQAGRYGSTMRHPWATKLRDLGMRLMPSALTTRMMARVSRWLPPGAS